ncbi:hypothetical protein SLT67_22500 [Paenibacillus illinoisensis]|nr:hypothetical protein [Paenibacillus sp.]
MFAVNKRFSGLLFTLAIIMILSVCSSGAGAETTNVSTKTTAASSNDSG